MSTWEGKPGNAGYGEGGGALEDGRNMGMGMGVGGVHGTIDGAAGSAADEHSICCFFFPALPVILYLGTTSNRTCVCIWASVSKVTQLLPLRVVSQAICSHVFFSLIVCSSPRRLPSRSCFTATAASRPGSTKQLVSALLGGTRSGGPWGLGADGGGALGDIGGGDAWGGDGADRSSWNGAIEMKLTGDVQRESFVDGERWQEVDLRSRLTKRLQKLRSPQPLTSSRLAPRCRVPDDG